MERRSGHKRQAAQMVENFLSRGRTGSHHGDDEMWTVGQKSIKGPGRTKRPHLVDASAGLPVRRRISVLVVEDNADDIALIRRFLSFSTSFDARLYPVSSVDEAEALIATRNFDLVFSDFWVAGASAVAMIRRLAACLPVMVLSSMDMSDLGLISRRIGASGFMTKDDMSPETLDRVIASMLGLGLGLGGNPELPAVRRSGAGRRPSSWTTGKVVRFAPPSAAVADIGLPGETTLGEIRLGETTVGNGTLARFDLMAAICAMAGERERGDGRVHFLPPRMAVWCLADPNVVHDLLQVFAAECADALMHHDGLSVVPTLAGGALQLEMKVTSAVNDRPVTARESAVARERRNVLVALAETVGGRVEAGDVSEPARLLISIPLQPACLD